MDLAQKPVYKLDLAAGTSVVNLTTPLVEGDDRAQTFTLELTDKGAPANLNGYSVTAYFGRGKTAEAEADTIPLSGTVSGNVAAITLTESCYSRSCYFSMPIRLSNGATGQKRTYLIVRGTVVKSVDGTIIDPDGSVPSLDDLFAQIAVMERSRQAAEEATEEALAAAARADEAREGIQGDLATLSEELSDLTQPVGAENIYDADSDEVTVGAFLGKQGNVIALANGVISYYVPVEYGKTYTLLSAYDYIGDDCVYIHLYDENRNLLTNGDDVTCIATMSDTTLNGKKTFKVNLPDAKYTRFSYPESDAGRQFFNVVSFGLADDIKVFTNSNVEKLQNVLIDTGITCDDFDPIGIPAFDSGYFSHNDGTMKNVYSHKTFSVVPGETYKVSGYSYYNVMPVVLTDGTNVIDYFPKEETETPAFGSFTFEIPPNVTTMHVNRIVMGDTQREYYVSVYKKKGVTLKHHENKKLAIIGDSLSQPFSGVPLPYHRLLEAHDNFTVENFCRSGHGYYMDEDYDYAFWRQAGRVTSDTDVCLIFGSFNDMVYYDRLGDRDDTGTATICGCANTTFDTLFANNVGIKVGVILPTPWGSYPPKHGTASNYVSKIKAICEKRGIPYLDLFHESGMRPWENAFNQEYYHNADACHPNSKGHEEYIYPQVREFVKRLVN